jgi:hypothetical protein
VEAQPHEDVESAAEFLRSKLGNRKAFSDCDLSSLDDDMYCDEFNGGASCYFMVNPSDGKFPIELKNYLTNLLYKSDMFASMTVRGELNKVLFRVNFEA